MLFAIIASSLLVSLYFVFQTIEAERSQRQQVRETAEVLTELNILNRALLNAETGQRGYMITLDQRYLAPYFAGRDRYRPSLERLRTRISADATPRQMALMDEIESLSETRFAEMRDVVALLDARELMEARRRVLTDEGQEAMDRLRRSFREIEAIENYLLAESIAETARFESRVLQMLAGLLVVMIVAIAFGYILVTRNIRAESEAAQAAALGEARDQADLLAKELNHRVKNLFAVILAIVQMSGRDRPEAKEVVDRIGERVRALLKAHEVTQGTLERPVASLEALIGTTLAPYRSTRQPARLEGPQITLAAQQVTPLGLVLHELTTNAVKYGCWASGGHLEVAWSIAGQDVVVEWRENCAGDDEEPARQGFGSMLMTSAARQLRGTIDRQFTKEGVRVVIVFPLAEID